MMTSRRYSCVVYVFELHAVVIETYNETPNFISFS